MANEAALRLKLDEACPFTCADGTGIAKGALLKLTDPRTAIISSAAADKIAGICAREKVASDGRTECDVYRRGWFDMSCSGSVNIGDPVVAADTSVYPNFVGAAAITASGANIIGHALEAGTNGEVILIDVNIGAGSGAVS